MAGREKGRSGPWRKRYHTGRLKQPRRLWKWVPNKRSLAVIYMLMVQLEETSTLLPKLLYDTQTKLQNLLSSAQELSLQRYQLADKLAALVSELSSEEPSRETEQEHSVMEQMKIFQTELAKLQAALTWVTVLDQTVTIRWVWPDDAEQTLMRYSEKILSPESHHPSPLSALPHYRELYELVDAIQSQLPPGMGLLNVLVEIREQSWRALKDIMSQWVLLSMFGWSYIDAVRRLLKACEPLKWPLKVKYADLPAFERRAFERAYLEILLFQAEYGWSIHIQT
jgi:hypothetical protein